MNNIFDKELRGLVYEIIIFVVLLIVVVPICVNASNKYKENVSRIEKCSDILVSIDNKNGKKFVILENIGDEGNVSVNLVLKMSNVSNKYMIRFGGSDIYLDDLNYTFDGEFYYYDLGGYTVSDVSEFEYELFLVGDEIYNDSVIYSFIAEVLFC